MKKHVAFYHTDKVREYKHVNELEIKVEDEEKSTLEENGDPLGDGEEEEEKKVEEFPCPQCEKSFKNKNHLHRHQATHSGVVHSCSQCSSTFSRRDKLTAHVRKKHQTDGTETEDCQSEDNFVETESNSVVTNDDDNQLQDQEAVDFEELLDE